MKKILSLILGFSALAAAAVVQPEMQVVTFFTEGSDKYEDGSVVLDNECYALVWSKDGQFDGLTPDGQAKGETEKVVYIGSLAKGGRCRVVEFHIVGGFTGGSFELWALDTRIFKNGAIVSVGSPVKGEDGSEKYVITHAAQVPDAKIAVSTFGASAPTTVNTAEGSSVDGSTVDLASVQPPQITDFKVDGDYVRLELANVQPGLNYSVVGSKTSTFENTSEGGLTTAVDASKILVILPKPADDAAFFKGSVKSGNGKDSVK